jgi:hypothetical protein
MMDARQRSKSTHNGSVPASQRRLNPLPKMVEPLPVLLVAWLVYVVVKLLGLIFSEICR